MVLYPRLLRTTDITKGKINWDTVPFCKDKPKNVDKYLLKDNDIVISRAGSIGESYILKNVDKAVFASYLIRFTPKKEVNPDYIAYFLKSPLYWRQVKEASLGIAIPNINATKLSKFALPLPERPIQDKIVEEIETQFTQLDAGVAALKRAQANLKRYRAAVLKAACEGKLVPTEAELAKAEGRHYETGEQLLQRILAERRAKWEEENKKKGGKKEYVEPKGPDVSSLPKLQEGWAWATVEQVAAIGSGNTPANIRKYLARQGSIPWFKVGDMNHPMNLRYMQVADNYISRDASNILGLRIFPESTIIFPKRGGAIATNKKRILQSEATTDLNVMGLTANINLVKYFWWWFSSLDLASFSDGSNVPQINHKDILPIPIPLPPLTEQIRIVEEVERQLSVVEKIEVDIGEKFGAAANLKKVILSNVLSNQH